MSSEDIEVKIDVEVLKRDVNTITQLCEKMDKVIEKLVDHQGVIINQIYDDMDKRKADTNSDVKELHSRITSTTRELSEKMERSDENIMKELKELNAKIQAHTDNEDRIVEKFLRYKWFLITGVIVISWLTAHVGPDTILKLLK